jgi:hypothetical protein
MFKSRLKFVALAALALAPGPATAGSIIIGPYPDGKVLLQKSVTATVDSFWDETVRVNGKPYQVTGTDHREFQINYTVPVTIASYLVIPTNFQLFTATATLTDVYGYDLNPSGPLTPITGTGFDPANPQIVPLGPENFVGASGQTYTAGFNETTTLGNLASVLPGYDLSVFSGDPDSIVYVSQATAPANEFLSSVPEPSTAAMIVGVILVLLGRRAVRLGRRARALLVLAVPLVLASTCRESAAGTVLFTASTDFTGGFNTIAPNSNNQYIPPISPGVTLSPGPAYLDNQNVGPLDGISYGPSYSQVPGTTTGTTGWVTSTYTIPTCGEYQLIWEVANVINCAGQDALATGNIRLNGQALFSFGGGLPAGFTGLGSYGTSGGVPGLSPTESDGAFAWMDVQPPPHATNIAPLFDPLYTTGLGDGYSASRLDSPRFAACTGDILQVDLAFVTNDGGNCADYGIVALQGLSVPEPSSVILGVLGAIAVGGCVLRRRVASRRGA